MTYQQYLEATQRRTLSPLVSKILHRLPKGAAIIDLGCGAGVEVEALARRGFQVTAVDREAESVAMVRGRCRGLGVQVYHTRIEDFIIPKNSFDAVFALLSLPFIHRDAFPQVLRLVEQGVRSGGFIVLRLFGPNDDWVKVGKVIGVEDAHNLFTRNGTFELYEETEKDGPTAVGDEFKHWHTIDLIYRVR